MGEASQSGGVKPMSIAGRLVSERERLLGMTDAERAFRKQWLQDQHLSPNEPRVVPEMYQELFNPIRRFYRWPLNQLENALTPKIGKLKAQVFRYTLGRGAIGLTTVYWIYYCYKYNGNDWTKRGGLRVLQSRQSVVPGDEGYPFIPNRTKGADYASRGFDQVTLNL